MNWIDNVVPPKIRSFLRRDTPENLWVKCPESGQLVFHKDLEANLLVVPGRATTWRSAQRRGSRPCSTAASTRSSPPEAPADPLKFRDVKRYVDRLKENRAKTGHYDAVTLALGRSRGSKSRSRCRISPSRAAASAWPRARRSSPG